jgi:glycosyltransferase involved in cell wall biosynthesis
MTQPLQSDADPGHAPRMAIGVFAHNEARQIEACLESIRPQLLPGDVCHVLNNGSTDGTGEVVRSYGARHPFCRLVDIEIGDKANAWNVFVHDVAADADLHVFLDGDCRAKTGALSALRHGFEVAPRALALAAVPDPAISPAFHRLMLSGHGVAGACYALSRDFIDRARQLGFRLPLGWIGDDSLVGAMVFWDLDPRGVWDTSRLIVVEDAQFEYEPLSPWSLSDLRLQYRRKVRYALRHRQNQMLHPMLKKEGLSAIPPTVLDLYRRAGEPAPVKGMGPSAWFDRLARQRILAALSA